MYATPTTGKAAELAAMARKRNDLLGDLDAIRILHGLMAGPHWTLKSDTVLAPGEFRWYDDTPDFYACRHLWTARGRLIRRVQDALRACPDLQLDLILLASERIR